MRIAMIGQKGIPATNGGVERHVEELGSRLAQRGHEVVVFTRPTYADPSIRAYRGMQLVSIPTIHTKHLDAAVHSFLASWATWGGGFDIVHYHAIGPSAMAPIARLRGRRVVSTIHGQDWRREKWGRIATRALRAGEWMALTAPNATISVSQSLAKAYRENGHRNVTYIPNGVVIYEPADGDYLSKLGLQSRRYILYAGRLVPEKAVHTLIEAHAALGTDVPLVIAGETSHSAGYVESLRRQADPDRVRFVGYANGRQLATLFSNATVFVLPSTVEGQPLVLLEALAYGVPVIASDIPQNLEVVDDQAIIFPVGDVAALRDALENALAHKDVLLSTVAASRDRILSDHDWEHVAEMTEALYERVLEGAVALAPGEEARMTPEGRLP